MVDRLQLTGPVAATAAGRPPLGVPKPVGATADTTLAPIDTYKSAALPGSHYDLPVPRKRDKWESNFERDALPYGRRGWQKYGALIKEVARKHGLDPYVFGAYIWNESNFNPRQDFSAGGMRAVGLGSVQAQYFRRYTVAQLQDPRRNLELTAREFKASWKPARMSETLLDVFYPAWRRKHGRIPGFKNKEEYLQLVANKVAALRRLDAERALTQPVAFSR